MHYCYTCFEGAPRISGHGDIPCNESYGCPEGNYSHGRKMAFYQLAKTGRTFDIKEEARKVRAELGLEPCPELILPRRLRFLSERGFTNTDRGKMR